MITVKGHGMITAKGVRAGMNPAPTNLPKPTLLTFAVYSLEVDFCCVFILVLPLFSLVGPIFVGPKYKKKPNSVYIFVFTTNQIYSTWN